MSYRDHGFNVSVEANHLPTRERAEEIRDMIRDRLSDLPEDIYVTICEYDMVQDGSAYACEHGVKDGDWCEQCNAEYKAAREDPENGLTVATHPFCEDCREYYIEAEGHSCDGPPKAGGAHVISAVIDNRTPGICLKMDGIQGSAEELLKQLPHMAPDPDDDDSPGCRCVVIEVP